MSNQEELFARLKERLRAQREEEQSRLRIASEHGIEYSEANRPENLRLLRAFFNATQENFATLLGVGSQSQYSQLERGERGLTQEGARRIERELGIPHNWLDRRNGSLLFLSLPELSLVNEARVVQPDTVLDLAGVVKRLTGRGG